MNDTLGVALAFQPAVLALLSAREDSVVITRGMINDLKAVLDVLGARAQNGLQADLAAERFLRNDLENLVGKTPTRWLACSKIGWRARSARSGAGANPVRIDFAAPEPRQ